MKHLLFSVDSQWLIFSVDSWLKPTILKTVTLHVTAAFSEFIDCFISVSDFFEQNLDSEDTERSCGFSCASWVLGSEQHMDHTRWKVRTLHGGRFGRYTVEGSDATRWKVRTPQGERFCMEHTCRAIFKNSLLPGRVYALVRFWRIPKWDDGMRDPKMVSNAFWHLLIIWSMENCSHCWNSTDVMILDKFRSFWVCFMWNSFFCWRTRSDPCDKDTIAAGSDEKRASKCSWVKRHATKARFVWCSNLFLLRGHQPTTQDTPQKHPNSDFFLKNCWIGPPGRFDGHWSVVCSWTIFSLDLRIFVLWFKKMSTPSRFCQIFSNAWFNHQLEIICSVFTNKNHLWGMFSHLTVACHLALLCWVLQMLLLWNHGRHDC